MNYIKKGDIVGRKSYNKDIIFTVKNIIRTKRNDVAILKGVTKRIEVDSNLDDLEIIKKKDIKKNFAELDNELQKRIEKINREDDNYRIGIFTKDNRTQEKIITGKILHLDGDRKYSEKSCRYYRKIGLNAVVKNIPEYKQPRVVYNLLEIYNPDILVITGHDGMIKRGTGYDDIYNYRNSRHFINTVKEARRYDRDYGKNLVIFAGACQSYFEAIISAGANFASSPARILIDFLDPLIVAEKVAFTEMILQENLEMERRGLAG